MTKRKIFFDTSYTKGRELAFALIYIGLALFVLTRNSRSLEFGAPIGIVMIIAGMLLAIFRSPSTPSPQASQTPPRKPVRHTVRLTSEFEWNSQLALHLIEQLAAVPSSFMLVLEADHSVIQWHIVEPRPSNASIIEPIIHSIYPTAEITTSEIEPQDVHEAFYRIVIGLKMISHFVAPIAQVTRIKQGANYFDPLVALTQAMNGLQPGERVRVTLAILGFASEALKNGQKLITQSTIHPLQLMTKAGIQDALLKKVYGLDRVARFVPDEQRVLEDKLNHRLYHCVATLQIDGVDTRHTAELAANLTSQFTHYSNLPFNALEMYETDLEACITYVDTPEKAVTSDSLNRISLESEKYRRHQEYRATHPGFPVALDRRFSLLILEPREIASLWHLPHSEFTASRIAWSRALVSISDRIGQVTNGVRLGDGMTGGQRVPVLLPDADRVTHLNIVGRTGMGKSTLMHHLIHQDIAAGRGVAVIDPHGKLVSDILRTSIPDARANDVVVLDLANTEYPPPLNPLVAIDDYTSTLRMVSIIDRMFEGTEESARMASYLRASLIPLQGDRQATMRDVTRLFMDEVFRQERLMALDDSEAQDFWDFHYNPSSPALQRQISEPIIIRVRPFYANPTLYPVLCHPDRLDFRALIESNKIILISLALDEERVPEQERNLVGALLMSRLQMSGMKERAQRQAPFFIYVDEVQKFVTTSLSDMFSEARKFGLSLVTANQYLDQLTGKTLEAVMGNVGTTVVFRCSPDDGQTLAAYMQPEFKARQLANLDRFQAAVKMQVHGETQPAFSLLTLEPPCPKEEPLTEKPPLNHFEEQPEEHPAWSDEDTKPIRPLEPPPANEVGAAREEHLRQLSRDRYTPKHRREVLDWLNRRYRRGNAGEGNPVGSDPGGDPSQFFDAPGNAEP